MSFCWSIETGRVVAADEQPVTQRFVGMQFANFISELCGRIAESGGIRFGRSSVSGFVVRRAA